MNNRNDKELFKLVSTYKPTGDQPEAIAKLVEGIKRGDKEQTLLGVTGSGKTFTMANIISQVQKPTLVLAHNKPLPAHLCGGFPPDGRSACGQRICGACAVSAEFEYAGPLFRHPASGKPGAGCPFCGRRWLRGGVTPPFSSVFRASSVPKPVPRSRRCA